jgi:CMP/dCMP kinase
MNQSKRRLRPIVAIDGPAGAGKSTVARLLAQRLGFVLLDTGALYRAVALIALERSVSWQAEDALGALAGEIDLQFRIDQQQEVRVFVDGADRSGAIRTPQISLGASHVSQYPSVRQALLGLQRRLGESGGVVVEGRDIGTVVFPDAELMVFLTADRLARALRRVDELSARGIDIDFETTLAEVRQRDSQDQDRDIAPLRPAEDAIHVDTTGKTIDEVVRSLEALVRSVSMSEA